MSVTPAVDSERMARELAELADSKKTEGIVALDMRGLVGYTDFLVICTARNERQAKAIHDAVHLAMKDRHRLLPGRVEGEREARWILLDYLDCVMHVFTPAMRQHYRLDQLWGEAPRLELDLAGEARAPAAPPGG